MRGIKNGYIIGHGAWPCVIIPVATDIKMKERVEMNKFISVGQAAKRLGMNYKKICRWADAGRIPCIRTSGGHRRVDISFLVVDKAGERSLALGRMLRKFRKDRGLTLREMAAAIGVSAAFISSIETGKKKVPGDFIDRVRTAYNLKENLGTELFEGAGKEPEVISIDMAGIGTMARKLAFVLIKKLPSLTEAEMTEIIRILENRMKEST